MGLSQGELEFFETFGFLKFPGLLNDQIGTITEAFDRLWTSTGGGHNGSTHDEKKRSCMVQFMDRSEVLSELLIDAKIQNILISLLGLQFNYLGSDGNFYVGDTGWHSDGWHKEPRHIKIAFYLDPLTRDTGCLRVIPGTHRLGDVFSETVGNKIQKLKSSGYAHGKDIPAVALETTPGDLLVFDWNLKHAAFGGGTRRRMFTLNACGHYPEHLRPQLREMIAGSARFLIDQYYGEVLLRTVGSKIKPHLEQVLANADHLPELVRQQKLVASEPSRG